jgi:hypothetical protein
LSMLACTRKCSLKLLTIRTETLAFSPGGTPYLRGCYRGRIRIFTAPRQMKKNPRF